ncbi:MAG: hypothetical protein ACTHJL_01025 [Amnibacterium sp.]
MKRSALLLAPLLALAGVVGAATPAAAAPHVVVVAPSGSDRGSGSVAHPLRTIDAAIHRLADGGVVELRGGAYHQRVTLDHVEGVTIEPYRHERVLLSGAGLTPPHGRSAMVTIVDSRRVTVRDLDITGYTTSDIAAMPIGVYIHGWDDQVRILGLHVHDQGNDNGTLGSFDINAHGIAAYGDDVRRPITRLTISGNTLDHLRLGASETVVVNGNVDHWAITGNRIHDDDNIGIDAIGFEPTIGGAARYTDVNRARNGLISGNTVSRIRSQGNPAYWEDGSWCDCADGIYVDGGTRIRITGNRVDGNDIGIEVAAENARGNASHVTVDHNVVTGSLFTGITTGGYCDGGQDCGGVRTGSSYDNVFAFNRLSGNNVLNDGSPELLVQYFAHDDRFLHNDITATNDDHVVYGTVDRANDGAGDVSDHNTFRVAGGSAASAVFGWRGTTYTGFAAYRAATHQDRHSTFR